MTPFQPTPKFAPASARHRNAAFSNPTSKDTAAARHDAHGQVISSAPPSLIHVLSPLPSRSPSDVGLPARPKPAHLSPKAHDPSPFSSSLTLNECCTPRNARATSPKFGRMGLSKEQRIGILLGIDGVFFLIELSVGTFLQNARKINSRTDHA